ncbi:hypothetical protein POTOM_032168 [Populus tomentosa]|uniref:Retroviral polymerase SH3-like domain-containing protein n=1 Tax=Populus tomentosa TaxID=118781 RepID=A0A8X7ZBW5_POPTO|nr:hypothetical protein POTOM_032168 [Populus tomentosa]
MRLHSGLPQTFWADAVHTAVYLINRGPSVPLEFRLPEEVWRGKEVQLSHLKVFGCVSYVHIDSDTRNKLEAKSKKCFFIGYGDEEFGFRFWDDQNRKIIRSRNVIFNEKVMYKDRSSEETEMADSDTSPQRSEFIRLEGLPDVTEPNNNQESLQEDSSTSVPTTTQEDAEPIEPAVRRSSRTIKPPQRFTLLLNYILLTDGGEPLTYEESLQDGNSSKSSDAVLMQQLLEGDLLLQSIALGNLTEFLWNFHFESAIPLVQYLCRNRSLGKDRQVELVVDAGSGTAAIGLGSGALCLGYVTVSITAFN